MSKTIVQQDAIPLKESPSLIHNNLSLDNETSSLMVVASSNRILVICLNSMSSKAYLSASGTGESSDIQCVKICKFEKKKSAFIVAGRQQGVQVWDALSLTPIVLSENQCKGGERVWPICITDYYQSKTDEAYILVGNSSGAIELIQLIADQSASSKSKMMLKNELKHHKHAITALVSGKSSKGDYVIISADSRGDIVIWRDFKAISFISGILHEHPSTGVTRADSVIGLGILESRYLVVAYGFGKIRIFDIDGQGVLICEFIAHAKWITAMDVKNSSNLIVTVSEDCHVILHRFDPSNRSIRLESNIELKDCALTGVHFQGKDKLYVSAFEKKQIYSFSIS